MPWCLPLSGSVMPWQPARIICNNPASNSQMAQSKATDTMQQQAEVQGSFPSPGGLSLFWQVIAGQTKPSRSLLWQSGCCMIHHFCCISTFIYTFSYDLMHGQILSTSVALSEDSLLLFQLFSVNFYWTVLQCHFMFYVLKIINKFCFRKLKWKTSLQVDSWWLLTAWLSPNL